MRCCAAVLIAWLPLAATVAAGEVETALAKIKRIGPQAAGAVDAAAAWNTLAKSNAREIPALLAAIDDDNPLAANYIRSAIEAITEREGGKLHVDILAELARFIEQTDNNPRARRMAFELLVRAQPENKGRMLSNMLHDPSVELRRDAVAQRMSLASLSKLESDAIAHYKAAFDAAVDDDQVKEIAKRLANLDEEVDIARHYGFILKWSICGPFDNAEEMGFDKPRGPEGEAIDLSATYKGSHGVGEVRWQAVVSDDEYGRVDLNDALGKHKSAVGYAVAHFDAAEARPVELRYKSKNACKVWLNGKLAGQNEVYHSDGGPSMDQYVCKGEVKRGANTVFVKICQNDQEESWAQDWAFQLRVCDAVGAAVLPASE